jgi:esterase
VVTLFHRELGGAGKPPLVILHGMLGSSRNWQTAGTDLAVHYHVFALDLRNHGRSPHREGMRYEALMSDVVGWLDAQQLETVTLLGHSMGGKTAMLLACRYPQRVGRLIVVDIAPKRYFWVAHRASFAAMTELNLADLHSRAEAELRFESRVPNWATRKFLTTNLEQDEEGNWRWQINLPAITGSIEELEANPLMPDDRYDGPTRFIAGGKSNYIEAVDHPTICAHFPHAQIVTIAESGHNPHMETRQSFVKEVFAAAKT